MRRAALETAPIRMRPTQSPRNRAWIGQENHLP